MDSELRNWALREKEDGGTRLSGFALLLTVEGKQPLVLASVVLVTLAAAMAASYLPARKILRQTPGRTLRDI